MASDYFQVVRLMYRSEDPTRFLPHAYRFSRPSETRGKRAIQVKVLPFLKL